MRMLVTGSRNWRDPARLRFVLDSFSEALAHHHRDRYIKEGLVLVSGHANSGVDRFAEQWYADRFPLEKAELHPANWKADRRRAGLIRNVAMVENRIG